MRAIEQLPMTTASAGAGDDLFTPTRVAQESETKPLSELIKLGVESDRKELHTSMPAKVLAVRPGQVDVQLLILRKLVDGTLMPFPALTGVPLWQPRGNGYFIFRPGEGWEYVLFSERSLDLWKVSTGVDPVNPLDSRMHNLSDGFFVPGLYPNTNPIIPTVRVPDPTALIIGNGVAEFRATATGQFSLSNGPNEVVALLGDILARLADVTTQLGIATTNTVLGPQPLNNGAAFVALTAQLVALQVQLATLTLT